MMYWVMLRIRALMLRIGIDSFVLLLFELKLALDDYYSVVPVPFAVARIDWEWALELLDVLDHHHVTSCLDSFIAFGETTY